MSERSKKSPEEQGEGVPEWLVTFSDCMTLLLTFFVLLLTFSSFDNKKYRKLLTPISGAMAFLHPLPNKDRDAVLPKERLTMTEKPEKGSEQPTLKRGDKDHLKKEIPADDFRKYKVFLISSEKVFWGRGAVLSSQGQRILSSMGDFLRNVASRIVVSEAGSGEGEMGVESHLARAWAVVYYLSRECGIDKSRLSISASRMVERSDSESPGGNKDEAFGGRVIEIVLLERSIYH